MCYLYKARDPLVVKSIRLNKRLSLNNLKVWRARNCKAFSAERTFSREGPSHIVETQLYLCKPSSTIAKMWTLILRKLSSSTSKQNDAREQSESSFQQAIMMSLQDRLSTSTAEAQQAQQRLAALEQKIHGLEVEKTLAASSEQRLSTSISQVFLCLKS